jgi:vancomycin resistance protein YoaR
MAPPSLGHREPAAPPPRRPTRIGALRWLATTALLGAALGASAFCVRDLLPRRDEAARGLRVGGVALPLGIAPRAAAADAAASLLARRFTLTWDGERVVETSLAELGARVDEEALARRIEAPGHAGSIVERLDGALEARRGHIDVPVPVSLPIERLADRLERLKEERDHAPVAARLDLATRAASGDAPGRYLDVYGALAALDHALDRGLAPDAGAGVIAIPAFTVAPRASREVVSAIDTSALVARYETHYGELGDQRGRAQNVRRAAQGMDGVVLMPGETVSFNANVGPRSLENGFALAPEIYKGEMREGVGGGTCQVAGTLHAAATFGGLDVVERSSHSRPSGYIRMGLDATVVYPTVDLKLRNPYDFPIVLHAKAVGGALAFELRGARKAARVELTTATLKTTEYKRKIEEDPALAEGAMVKKQKGIRGYTVKKTRTVHLASGKDRIEVSTDVYPPTFEVWHVAPGADLESLPPLPEGEEPRAGDGATASITPPPR